MDSSVPHNHSPDVVADELTSALHDLAARSLASAVLEVGVRRISTSDVQRLAPAEHALTTHMSPVRLAEFATGRRLLHDLVGTSDPILRDARGAPLLPASHIGSLAHDRDHAVAVLAPRASASTIGVDLEPLVGTQLDDDEAEIIVRIDDAVPNALAAFVMKEATYKAWSASGGLMLDHHDVRIEHDHGGFLATVLVEPAAMMPTVFAGQLVATTRHWVALAIAAS